jgi:hypothetical protein
MYAVKFASTSLISPDSIHWVILIRFIEIRPGLGTAIG